MSTAIHRPLPVWSIEDFLAWEERQDERHEFIDGHIVAMVGARAGHKRLVMRIQDRLREQLSGVPCEVFDETFKLVADGNSFYPDLLVICEPPDDTQAYVEDAELVVEIASDSTALRDRTRKVDAYLTLPSLAAYVIVSEDGETAEVWTRTPDSPWMTRTEGLSEVHLLVHDRDVTLC